MRGAVGPELLEPPVAPAAESVEVIANWVALIIVLVIVLGRIESRRFNEFCDNLAGKYTAVL